MNDNEATTHHHGSPPDQVVLEFKNVSKTFTAGKRKIKALDNVEVRVPAGVITGLIGPDGAGKTTLMRLAAGLLVPDTGTITVLGLDATHDSLAVQASIGYMPQRFGLYEDLTVQENLDLYADLQGVARDQRVDRYRELMRMTGLAPFTSRLAGRLSGGMKQKLGLACTLIHPPQLLLLDEPTVGVDPVSRRELWSIVDRLVREQGMSVVLSTAYLDEAEQCHEVIMLHLGKLLGKKPPGEFSRKLEGHAYTVRAPGLNKRNVQKKLAQGAGVIDAVIQGERVRLVMDSTERPAIKELLEGSDDALLQPVPARFEDSFIAMLRSQTSKPKSLAPQTDFNQRRRIGGGDNKVIEVHDVARRFGDFYAVKHVTFDVKQGEVFGLLGANGAGKSTTFRMLCGLLPPSGGQLRVAGLDLRKAAAAARARIGYMSQKFSLYGNLSVRQNLNFFSGVYGLHGQRRAAKIAWALQQFELEGQADAVSSDLPLGYKQRLAMACALMHEPEILFLDEPTSGVDPLARREFWLRINELAEQGVTVLVTTHFMEEAEYCDRLAIMSAGKILALGVPAEIKQEASSRENADPTMEDAFISLIQADEEESESNG
ncbi:ATP-binding cassette domain-containing protein [Desulfoferrobacter suflitae]|uniref:ATP-binding cassette domain-containing protein n=1 Tax=Desulfoferrobacter suflitae TaxID=2865782 RepID=UPI00216486BC|nr:ATP-binding cassette domain-containing protein [Desulfoferrobacter suflitae]MCK8600787.1 ATP-binding cassette domain-containing protein [Desulfoferrobacter suflitae]